MSCSIIGLAAQFSKCKNLDDFWQVLEKGESLIEAMTEPRWDRLNHDCANPQERRALRGMFLDDVDCFDRKLFSMSPPAAMFADPRQRLLLQSCWSAIEDAGLKKSDLAGQNVGVFVAQDAWYSGGYIGTNADQYLENQEFVIPGNNPCFLANRISNFFDFHGPSLVFNTTCSSVYVALHHACQAIANGECDYALVGGVTLFHHPLKDRFECDSDDMASFSNSAAGYRSSEGCGAFVLQRSDLTEQKRHSTYGLIRATHCNSGGKTNSFAQPSQAQLVNLYKDVLNNAQLSADQIDYIEAHGIASQMGDAIEANALLEIFSRVPQDQPCYVSTIKPNIGHAHAASGVYSLIKALLCFKYNKIPAIRNFREQDLNQEIRRDEYGLQFVDQTVDWLEKKLDDGLSVKRHVLISSYGFSNVNAALVLEEASVNQVDAHAGTREVSPAVIEKTDRTVLICLSAQSENQLDQQIENLNGFIERRERLSAAGVESALNLVDLAYTLQVGREAMAYRWVAVVESIESLKELLEDAEQTRKQPSTLAKGKAVRGNPKEKSPVVEALVANPKDLDRTLVAAFESGDFEKLAALWVSGININWRYCYQQQSVRLIHLPVYPFAKERYWLPNSPKTRELEATATSAHPLLGDASRYSVCLQPSLAYIAEHVIGGQPILPGVASLELVRAAAERSGLGRHPCISSVSWVSPIISVEESLSLQIELQTHLQSEKDGRIPFVVSSDQDVYCKGYISNGSKSMPNKLDIDQCRSACAQVMSVTDCYNQFSDMGYDYGPALRSIADIRLGERQAYAKLELPKSVGKEHSTFCLHPSLIDGPLQVGRFLIGPCNEAAYYLPFSVESFDIYATPAETAYVYVSLDEGQAPDKLVKANILLTDAAGSVQVAIKNVSYVKTDVLSKVSHSGSSGTSYAENKKPSGASHKEIAVFVREPTEVSEQTIIEYVSTVFKEKLAELLRVDISQIDSEESFSDYGVDSIMGTNLMNAVNVTLTIDLHATDFFSYTSVKELAGYIASKHKDVLRAKFQEEEFLTCDEPLSEPSELKPEKMSQPDSIEKLEQQTLCAKQTEITNQSMLETIGTCITEHLSKLLRIGVDQIDADEAFSDYGIDSIMGTNLVSAINASLNIEVQITDLFSYSSVTELTDYILVNHKKELSTSVCQATRNDRKLVSGDTNSSVMTALTGDALLLDSKNHSSDFVSPANNRRVQTEEQQERVESIAIIGMSGRFANADNLDDFWRALATGEDLIEEDFRLNLADHYEQTNLTEAKPYTQGGFLKGIDQFDPLFFSISGREAIYMDPQQRFFLEESWKALEDAGYVGDNVNETSCGVYLGCRSGDYEQNFSDDVPASAFWGNSISISAARIAYYLNLQGPAIAVDTACSSSLVAIHMACQSLWSKESKMALAGGVFIQTTPEFYVSAAKAGMLSKGGRCHTFDDRADGFVPGEGVAAIVLKRLSEAQADGDHIYGVIKGSAINQDGATNGITAPSALSQERLETQVYERFQISPENIQMVEAHGTGTQLGDPIEFSALTKSFRQHTDKESYCALGSVKTNIGHTIGTAGVASVIKVLLSLKHKKIPPNLHYQKGNSNIAIEKSPFYVPTDLKEWTVENNLPRAATVSSFGFSGTNAHLVIEEAPQLPGDSVELQAKPAYLIALSARSKDQLCGQVENMLAYLKAVPGENLGNISHTLLVGRKHWNCRLACVVRSIEELRSVLEKWLAKGSNPKVYVALLADGEKREQVSMKRYGNNCIASCFKQENAVQYLEDLSAIADLYIQGYALAYENLFDSNYLKISLPTYPFAKESYWFDDSVVNDWLSPSESRNSQVIRHQQHPLLHAKDTSSSKQKFCSVFTGQEFFLDDHKVQGKKTLPGVAYLEMARAAVDHASIESNDGFQAFQIEDVVWLAPVIVDNPKTVFVTLLPSNNTATEFEISTGDSTSKPREKLHGQGRIKFIDGTQASPLNLRDLINKNNKRYLDSHQCYKIFKRVGIDYGAAHQGIDEVYVGEGELLAKIKLPESISETKDQFLLHPSILDSALQASIGLSPENDEKLTLPFALESIDVFAPCVMQMWALVTAVDTDAGPGIQKINISLCDESGLVCIKMIGVTLKVLDAGTEPHKTPDSGNKISTVNMTPVWTEQPVIQRPNSSVYAHHLVFIVGFPHEAEQIKENIADSHRQNIVLRYLELDDSNFEKEFEESLVALFKAIKDAVEIKNQPPILVQMIVPAEGQQNLFSSVSGLLKTAALEKPNIVGQVITISKSDSPAMMAKKILENSDAAKEPEVSYQTGKRCIRSFQNIARSRGRQSLPWKEGGVYLISGGAGGLGLIFAKEIIEKVKKASVILIGRSTLANEKRQLLHSLGTSVEYRVVDICDKKAVVDLAKSIEKQHGGINGIIHAAGITRDGYILNKTELEYQCVIAPKITGTLNLDYATQKLDIDFFVLFSSFSGAMGNAGQADYATANAFLDTFSEYRNSLVDANQRFGQTSSINWPLWESGGMSVDAFTEDMLRETVGMVPMTTSSGIEGFYQALSSNKSQFLLIEGEAEKINAYCKGKALGESLRAAHFDEIHVDELLTEPEMAADSVMGSSVDEPKLIEKAEQYLKRKLADLLKIPERSIEANSPLSSYGIDSVLALDFIKELEKELGSLSKTLLFEYENVNSLAGYFLSSKKDQIFPHLNVVASSEKEESYSSSTSVDETTGDLSRPDFDENSVVFEKDNIVENNDLHKQIMSIRGVRSQDAALLEMWPLIFIPKTKDAYLHFLKDDDLIFATEFTGNSKSETRTISDFSDYCRTEQSDFCYLDMSGDRKVIEEERQGLISLPVGVTQLINITNFTLAGKKMRRLRYMVEKFRKLENCRTVEYKEWNAEVNSAICHVIDAWSKQKKVVNNVDVILDAMGSGQLLDRYRVFLTYLEEELQNVILILPIENGYLMDQEYYLADMPLGGTEFAVIEIIAQLANENYSIFSLGLTWGLIEPEQGFSDSEGWEWVNETQGQLAQIFERGMQNHQYKNKYRPIEKPVYLYRPLDTDKNIVARCLSQFFKKGINYQEVKKLIDAVVENIDSSVESTSKETLFDATKILPESITLDLISDSWPYLRYPFIDDRMRALAANEFSQTNEKVIDELFGLQRNEQADTILTGSGRSAERLFFQTYPTKKRKIVQNLLFYSTLHHSAKAGFEAIEIPDPEIFQESSKKVFRGGIDFDQLDRILNSQLDQVGMIFIELCNNASGGYPVSLEQIRKTAQISQQHQIPLVLDTTRIVRNAELIRRYEDEYRQKDIWLIVKEIVSHADFIIGSLCKDFALNIGGIVRSNDKKRIDVIRQFGKVEGGLLTALDKNLVLAGLKERNYLQEAVKFQLDMSKEIHEKLAQSKVPAVQPGVGHCVLIPVSEFPQFRNKTYPREEFLRQLYEKYGIRGGTHLVGNQHDTRLNECIRLALPLGLKHSACVSYICTALGQMFENRSIETSISSPIDFYKRSKIEVESSPLETNERAEPSMASSMDIAIIGLSGRYPGAVNAGEFWDNLKSGKTSITEVPGERWDWNDYYEPDLDKALELNKSYGKWGGFLEGFSHFDAEFFNIPSEEVERMDPQERLFLEECWKALEDAGYRPSELPLDVRQRAAIYGGVTKQGFNLYSKEGESSYVATSLSTLVSRVSYFLDFKGPSIAIDNHCSSSLVAIHEACEYLRHGKGQLALAGGVNLNLHPSTYLHLSKAKLLSTNEESAAFGQGGAGYVPGEAVGVVVLKSYQQAIEDRDNIYAIVRGSAINQNGKMSNFGLPSQKQQEEVIKQALSETDIDPRTISYIEAAASGSEMMATIEMAALTKVFDQSSDKQHSSRIGSVKPNIGHCEAASGISQLTKVIFSLKNKVLAPTVLTASLNPNVDFSQLPFKLQTKVSKWEPSEVDGQLVPRRAGITATGGSGVNAHIIVEEHIQQDSANSLSEESKHTAATRPFIFILSAKNKNRLMNYVENWLSYLQGEPNGNLEAMAYTLQVGREAMDSRLAIVSNNRDQLLGQLKKWRSNQEESIQCFCSGSKTAERAPKDKISDAIKGRDLTKIAELWVRGNNVPWADLYSDNILFKVGQLPTYPFERKHYWLEQTSEISEAPTIDETEVKGNRIYDIREPVEKSSLQQKTLDKIKHLFSDVINVSAARIDTTAPLEVYGIDSLMINQLNKKLSGVFNNISTTLLFEYQTIGELALYFSENHREACEGWFGHEKTALSTPNKSAKSKAQRFEDMGKSHLSSTQKTITGSNNANKNQEAIAIIGISGCYPEADTLDKYWENLKAGKNSVIEVPDDRWSLDEFFHPDKEEAIAQGKSYSKWGGFLQGFAEFDPLFFNISPKEAMAIDPQERLFLQSCWSLLEDAGYTKQQIAKQYKGRVGVFAGITREGFNLYGPDLVKKGQPIFPRTSFSSVPNRVSYTLNLHGPSMPIDTMCSSSLTAIHEACEHIRHGSCEMAIAGGVNLCLHPSSYSTLSSYRMLSPDGQCKSFGKGANGYVPGEGVGTILLKKLANAEQDQDYIHAVIRGTNVNHGGKTNGYFVPNPKSQSELVREALDSAGINAREVSYIEAHSTGTELGDPIEITGLTQAFEKDTAETGFCAVGSVKSNIGHLEAASGIAGVTKILLQMRYKKLVPSLHVKELNPNIDFSSTPFTVNDRLSNWDKPIIEGKSIPRTAGVSSFGAGGANAHVLIEEYIAKERLPVTLSSAIVIWSAKDIDGLNTYIRSSLEFIQKNKNIDLYDFAYTLQIGREAMGQRFGLIVDSIDELKAKLQEFIDGKKNIVNLFSGETKSKNNVSSVFEEDEDMTELIDKWISKQKYKKILAIWVQGQDINWQNLYVENKPRRISIPTYPFVKESYWIDIQKTNTSKSTNSVGSENRPLPAAECSVLNSVRSVETSFAENKQWQKILAEGGFHDVDMEGILEKMLLSSIQSFERAGEPLHPSYQPWLNESLSILNLRGYLNDKETVAEVCSSKSTSISELWSEWDKRKTDWCENASKQPLVELSEVCLQALPEILSGKKIATSVMFPEASMKLVEAVYKDNPVSDLFNDSLAEVLSAYITEQIKTDSAVKIRILEIGAGTGGTTSKILPSLAKFQNSISEYCYTDLSKAFLIYGEQNYADQAPYLKTKIFNVEKPLPGQSVEVNTYDIVIATNVLHATKNIRQTLRNVKATLKKDGVLLLNEISEKTLFSHLTFGLLEGWWLYKDKNLRIPGSPGLYPDKWLKVLTEEGFSVTTFPMEKFHMLGQQIIVTRSDGLVSQESSQELESVKKQDENKRKNSKQNLVESDKPMEAYVIESIVENLSKVAHVKINKIETNAHFESYGIDSILGMSFVMGINNSLELNLQPTDILECVSVNELADYIVLNYKDELLTVTQSTKSSRSGHVEQAKPKTHKDAVRIGSDISVAYDSELIQTKDSNVNLVREHDERGLRCIKPATKVESRILVFHPLGFGIESIAWMKRLPEEIEVWAVGTSNLSSWETLIPSVAESINQLFDKPTIVWGHSMGGIIAFEVMKYLDRAYGVAAKQVIISSVVSPVFFENIKTLRPFCELDETKETAEIEKILVESHVLLPKESGILCVSPEALLNDISLCKTYSCNTDEHLNTPLTIIQAKNDLIIKDVSPVKHWGEMVTGSYSYTEIEGVHAFFVNPPKAFIQILIQHCRDKF